MAHLAGNDGKELEDLIATIEILLVPRGFTVEKNRRVYDDNGVQVGEFDIEIRGKLGSADITWLIECRNRPSEGPAPSLWIEQLDGRRSRFNFNKVTAVSTTGFAAGAVAFANTAGIDLREVSQIAPELTDWLRLRSMGSQEVRYWVNTGGVLISESESPERVQAATDAVTSKSLKEPLLRSTQTGATISLVDAFVLAVREHPELMADVFPNQTPKHVSLHMHYPHDESHFVVDTPVGPVRITHINFEGELSISERDVPLAGLSEYRQVGSEQPVSQTAGFTIPVQGGSIALDLHHLTASGQIHIAVRQLGTATTDVPDPPPPKTQESKKSAKVAKKGAAKRVAAKAAKPRKAVAKSSARKPTRAAAKELPARYAAPKATATKRNGPVKIAEPALLAGGNPQIAKADGDAPVQAYIAAMPGWKSDVGCRLDALIVSTVPGVRKAVKWNSPFYGVEGQGWFLSFHTFTNYVKVAFFRGTSLRPVPPGKSKHKDVRYLDIHEDDELDEELVASWIRQAAALPGWVP